MLSTQCATIVVTCNGEGFAIHQGMMLSAFLQGRGYVIDQPIACAVNGRRIEKECYASTGLQDGDRIDVVTRQM